MPVFLNADSGRDLRATTDQDGRYTFRDLTPDHYRVFADAQGRKNQSFIPRDPREITLVPGEARVLEITVPDDMSGHARVQLDQVSDYSRWRVRNTFHTGKPWQAIAADGTLPLEIGDSSYLEIEDEARHRWHAGVPKEAEDGHVIHLSLAGAGYEGEVVDYVTSKPLPRIRVVATLGELEGVSAVTDAVGRFRITGLEAEVHRFAFNSRPDEVVWDTERSAVRGMHFTPSVPAAVTPPFLRIRLPVLDGDTPAALPALRISGQVIERASGQPLRNGTIAISAEFPEEDGMLFLIFDKGMTTLNNDGRYQLSLPKAPRFKGWVKNDKTGKSMQFEWTSVASESEETHDLVLE
jgi:hypothetical protein